MTSDTGGIKQGYGTRFITLTNLLKNGDFSAGQASWANNSNAPSTATFTNGESRIATDPSQRAIILQYVYDTYTDGDKIFYSARLLRESGAGFTMGADRDSGGYRLSFVAPPLSLLLCRTATPATRAFEPSSPAKEPIRHSS